MFKLIVVLGLALACAAYNLPGLPIDFTADDEVLAALTDDIAHHYAEEYLSFVKTGKVSPKLQYINDQMSQAHSKDDIFVENIEELGIADQFVSCTTCKAFVNVVLATFLDEEGELNGENREEGSRMAMLTLCKHFNLQTQEVCSDLFDLNFPYFDYLLENSKADSRSICGTLPISFCTVKKEEWNFSLKIDASKPLEADGPKAEKPNKTDTDLMVLHLTDIHYDPQYKEGNLADCEEPLCCIRPAPAGTHESKLAGFWSDYRKCDSPEHMIVDALHQIRQNHEKIDFIYHTGDIIPHNVWSTTKVGNLEMIYNISHLMSEKFPDIPIYSCLGNHEPHPANIFGPTNVPDEMNVKWLYVHMWDLWSQQARLPEQAKDTVLKGGYYTALTSKGHRIVALNSMDCYLYNWWILNDGSYVVEQLQWLHDVLLEAEKNNEKVHILSHIPSADGDCWTVWAREYNRLIERFRHVISGIFNGHTHKDEMNVHYSSKGHPIMVSWNGGSLTAFARKNPNYRLYEIESKNYEVVDHHTFIFNVTEANLHGQEHPPKWMKEYQFSEAFTNDLSPLGIDSLLVKMAHSPDLLRQYWKYKVTMADPKLQVGCNDKCLMKTICRLAKSAYNEKTKCRQLQGILEYFLNEEVTTEPPTEKPDGDGAASISASLTIITGAFLVLRNIF